MAIRSLSHPGELPAPDMQPGTRLRRSRERLGLTYRDVERASYELACQRGRPDFIYHLDQKEVCEWYDVPFEGHFSDGIQLSAPNTHLAAAPAKLRLPIRFDPAFDPRRTEFLTRMVERWGDLEGTLFSQSSRYLYGYVGVDDRKSV